MAGMVSRSRLCARSLTHAHRMHLTHSLQPPPQPPVSYQGGRAPAGARGLRTPKSMARARKLGAHGSAAVPRHHGEEDPWDVSMVGASELVMPPPHPRAMQDQADLESSRASSASDVSTLGGRYLSLPLSVSLTLFLCRNGVN